MLTDIYLSPTLLLALVLFAAVSTVTPGPNNIMLMVSGVNFGIRRTLPQMAGIFTGLIVIVMASGLGLGYVFAEYPIVRVTVMFLGIAYTLYLAVRIAAAGSLGGGSLAHPLRYLPSVAFQWVNPKLWAMAITAVALYVRPVHAMADTALLTVVFSLVNIPVMLLWAGFGVGLREVLQVPGRIRIFNIAMGLLLAVSVLAFLHR